MGLFKKIIRDKNLVHGDNGSNSIEPIRFGPQNLDLHNIHISERKLI